MAVRIDDQSQYDIVYMASHGFAVRMVMQTDLLIRLNELGYKVALVVPDSSDSVFTTIRPLGIDVLEFETKLDNFITYYLLFREYLLNNISDNPALLDKHIRRLKGNRSKGYYLFIRLCRLLNTVFSPLKFTRSLFGYLDSWMLRPYYNSGLFKKISPKVLVSTYPVDTREGLALISAKRSRVVSVIHLLSWDNITAKGRFISTSDFYLTWGSIMAQELRQYYGAASGQIRECGVAHFDQHIAVQKGQIRLNPDNIPPILKSGTPYLLFAMSSPYFAPGEVDIIEYIVSLLDSGEFGPNLKLLVRPHPQNVQGTLADYQLIERLNNLSSTRIVIDMPLLSESEIPWSMKKDDMLRLSHLLMNSKLVLNSGSTISLDAMILDKPVIITSFDGNLNLPYFKSARRLMDYVHLAKLKAFNGLDCVESYSQLLNAIKRGLEQADYKKEERDETILRQCGIQDGRATDRIIQSLINIVNSDEKEITG